MSTLKDINVNCFPQCSEPKLIEFIKKLNPCLDITILSNTEFLLQGNNNSDRLEQLKTKAQELRTAQQASADNQTQPISNEMTRITNKMSNDGVSFMDNVYGFISMLTAHTPITCYDIPIMKSPQIHLNNSSGWTKEQSLFNFIKSLSKQGIAGIALKAFKLNDIVSEGLDEIERLSALRGWNPRISPYFSLTDNPFSDIPRIQADIKLINDSPSTAEMNHDFLNTFIRGAVISTTTARNSDGRDSGDAFLEHWVPPRLFNVGLKFGATGGAPTEYVKRYFLCTLEANVSPEGVMRKNIPDAYDVSLSFTSLIPNTLDSWGGKFGAGTSMNNNGGVII